MKKNLALTRNEALEMLWRQGQLVWKLNSAQRKLYKMYYDSKYRIPVLKITRRGGKSFFLLILAIEQCLRKPNSTVHYACPTATMATKIITPTIREILKDCPKDLQPKHHKNDRTFEFPNGSKIQIEGVEEGNAERLRGTSTNLAIVDEAGFVDDLEYIVDSILMPQITTTNGKLILSSTPPKQMGHPFITKYQEKARANNAYVKLSVLEVLDLIANDPPHLKHLNADIIMEIKDTVGGDMSPAWRREYLVEDITDTTSAVIPEFTEELMKEVVYEHPRPKQYDAYTAMDPGLVDHTGILFAYLDFNTAQIIVEDEYFESGNKITTDNIALQVRNKENILWTDSMGVKHKVYLRVSDNDPILLNDLRQLHGINFIPANKKDTKEAAVNDLRIKMLNKKIVINPRCKNLIFQLRNAVWNKQRNSFARSNEAGHYDLVDALLYLVRTVQWGKNPFAKPSYDHNNTFYSSDNHELTGFHKDLKDLFYKKKNK